MSLLYRYDLCNLENGTLTFTYRGRFSCFFYFKQKNIIHFSYYNGWYPVVNNEEQYDITIKANNDYILVNGCYNKETDSWFYTTRGQKITIDPNIILVSKSLALRKENERVCIYYFDNDLTESLDKYYYEYCKAYDYLVNLYCEDKIFKSTIVILPYKNDLGAYRRDKLIVFSKFNSKPHVTIHEMAHSYASGANTNTWEDWLNETCAEWSSLAYDYDNNIDSFNMYINDYKKSFLQKYGNQPYRLKGNDDAHQNSFDTHVIGTLVFYDIYLEYGIEGIKVILQIFDRLKEKTTQSFLLELKNRGFDKAVNIISKCL